MKPQKRKLKEEKCLICSSRQTISFQSLQAESDNVVGGKDKCLSTHLWSIFILRRLLDFPKEECENLLQTFSGVQPGEWYKLCGTCAQLVVKTWEIHNLILVLEQKILVCRKQAYEKLKDSFASDQRDENRKERQNIKCARTTVREHFRDAQLQIIKEPNFKLHSNENSLHAEAIEIDLQSDNDIFTDNSSKSDLEDNHDPVFIPEDDDDSLPEQIPLKISVKSTTRSDTTKTSIKKRIQKQVLSCTLCSTTFSKQSQLKVHTVMVHKKDEIMNMPQPELGSLRISSKQSSSKRKTAREKDPIESSSSNKIYKCEICSSNFPSFGHLARHAEDHEKFQDTTCHICKFPSNSQPALARHYKRFHQYSRYFECEKCNFKTHNKTFLKTLHMQQHVIEENMITCENGNVSCKICTFTEDNNKQVLHHLRTIHGEELGLIFYSCPHCSTSYDSPRTLQEHILVKHERRWNYHCDKCGKGFLYPHHLNRHIRSFHSDIVREALVCDSCGKQYLSKSGLATHKYLHHRGYSKAKLARKYKRGLKCTHCGLRFSYKNALGEHRKTVHADLYTLQCSSCPERFIRIQDMLRHEVVKHAKTEQNQ